MKREVYIVVDAPELVDGAESVRTFLKEKFGHYATRVAMREEPLAEPTGTSMTIPLVYADLMAADASLETQLADFVVDNLRLTPEDLSCRDDADMLDQYVGPSGELDVTVDPREWILANPFINELVQSDPRYGNLIDYVVEQRGVTIKPAHYANQRNYWSSSTNGGLPIVKKKDATHEGTFMLHDLFHFTFQDPLPVTMSGEVSEEDAKKAFLMHRMASEASTLVLADMIAVHELDLEAQGYNVDKRRIYPVYRSITENSQETIGLDDIIDANMKFCFSGDTTAFTNLGADETVASRFKEKYEVFFTADFEWNAQNFDACMQELHDNPRLEAYYNEARADHGVQTVDTLYPNAETMTVSDVSASFLSQLETAFNYTSNADPMVRIRNAGKRYLTGQKMLFFRYPDAEVESQFNESVAAFMDASDTDEAKRCLDICTSVVSRHLSHLVDDACISAQDHELFSMHVPLYPANFINYEKEGDQYKDLSQRIDALGITL